MIMIIHTQSHTIVHAYSQHSLEASSPPELQSQWIDKVDSACKTLALNDQGEDWGMQGSLRPHFNER